MLHALYRRKSLLARHLNAPLLAERERFLQKVAARKIDLRSQRRIATFLLRIVESLELQDTGNTPVGMPEIISAAVHAESLVNKRKDGIYSETAGVRLFIDTALAWLGEMGLLADGISHGSTLRKVFERQDAMVAHAASPFFKERMDFCRYLFSLGMDKETVRLRAVMMKRVIAEMKLEVLRPITDAEIVRSWRVFRKKNRITKSRLTCYLAAARGWFGFLGLYERPKRSRTFPQIEEYIVWLQDVGGRTSATCVSHRSILGSLFLFLERNHILLRDISPKHLDDYCRERFVIDKVTRRTIISTIPIIRGFLSFAESCGWCGPAARLSLRAPRRYADEGIPYYVPWKSVQSMLAKSGLKTNPTGIRDHAMMMILATYGLRSSEVLSIRLDDIDWENETLFVRRAKSSRTQLMPLTQEVGEAIIRYLKVARDNSRPDRNLFLSCIAPKKAIGSATLYHAVATALKNECGQVKHCGPHCIRHSLATHLVNDGSSFKEVCDLLGHKDLTTTMIYAKVNLESLKKVADMEWSDVICG